MTALRQPVIGMEKRGSSADIAGFAGALLQNLVVPQEPLVICCSAVPSCYRIDYGSDAGRSREFAVPIR
jgi:hypothetical protein